MAPPPDDAKAIIIIVITLIDTLLVVFFLLFSITDIELSVPYLNVYSLTSSLSSSSCSFLSLISSFQYSFLLCIPPFPMISFQLQSIFKVSQQRQLHLSKPRVCTAIPYGTADAKVVNPVLQQLSNLLSSKVLCSTFIVHQPSFKNVIVNKHNIYTYIFV